MTDTPNEAADTRLLDALEHADVRVIHRAFAEPWRVAIERAAAQPPAPEPSGAFYAASLPEPSATAQRARELLDHIEKPVAGMPPAFHDFTFLMAVRDFLHKIAEGKP